jgi:hypothetical protein
MTFAGAPGTSDGSRANPCPQVLFGTEFLG